MLPMGAEWLSEAIVEKYAARAADPVQDAVHDPAARSPPGSPRRRIGVLVEPERNEVAHEAARLRNAGRIDLPQVAGEGIWIALFVGIGVAEKGGKVADGGEAQSGNLRILGGIDQFIKPARFEFRPLGQRG
jgi:hypothetical protein